MSESGDDANSPLFAVSAEFTSADALLAGARALRAIYSGRLGAYTPIPVPGLSEALGLRGRGVRPVAVAGALVGALGTMGMCVYATSYAYVFDIGGRPAASIASYIVPSIASGLLLGAACTLGALLVLNRLPRLNHPAFNIPSFTRATRDRFFLAVEKDGDVFDENAIERALAALAERPLRICRVPQ